MLPTNYIKMSRTNYLPHNEFESNSDVKASNDYDEVHNQDHDALHPTLQALIGKTDLEIELALEQSYDQFDALPDEVEEDMAYAGLETDSDDSEGEVERN